MNEKEFASTLADLLDEVSWADPDFGLDIPELAESSVATFENVGMMSNNAGVVIELADGSQFQITIVKR